MDDVQRCPECGAAWIDGKTCEDHFHQMLAWEFEHNILEVHHLTVLCYHLQHPSLYSSEGLAYGQRLLIDFVERGLTTGEVRRENGPHVDSGKRTFKIKGTPASHATYQRPITWRMTVLDIIGGGVENYRDNVRAWARLTLETLKMSGNLPADGAE